MRRVRPQLPPSQESSPRHFASFACCGAHSRPDSWRSVHGDVSCESLRPEAWLRPGSARPEEHRGTTDTLGGTPADVRRGSRRGRRRGRRAGLVAERPRAGRRRRMGPPEGGPPAGARGFRRDPGRGGAPGRNDAGRRGGVAGRLPAAARHARAVRCFSHLGSGHGSVPEEPGRGGPHRAGARRGDGRGGAAGGRVAPPAAGGEQVLLRAARQRHRDPAPGDVVGRADARPRRARSRRS